MKEFTEIAYFFHFTLSPVNRQIERNIFTINPPLEERLVH